MNDSLEKTMEELTHRIAIGELINRYSRFADRREPQKQAELFTEDGTIEIYHGEPGNNKPDALLRGRKELAAAFEGLKQYDTTYHLNGQNTLQLLNDSATGEVHCLSHHLWAENGKRMLMIMAIRYYDTYIHKDNNWFFGNRKLIIDFIDKRLST